jgi:hypothetical protein
MNIELIRKLQKNTTVFGELPEEEQRCLNDYQNHLESRQLNDWCPVKTFLAVGSTTYRIDPAWNPEPQPAEWICEGYEVCEIQTLTYYQNTTTFLGIKRNGAVVRLSELIDLPDFVGCVFEGALNAICPLPKLFNIEENVVFFSYSADNKPVTAKWAVFK